MIFANLVDILTYFNPSTLIVYCAVNVLLGYYFIVLRNQWLINGDPKLHERYPAFKRDDLHKISILRSAPFLLTAVPRLILTLLFFMLALLYHSTLMIGHKNGTKMHPVRQFFMRIGFAHIAGRIFALLLGVVWLKTERPKVDWRKYLGPDWVATYDKPSTLVSNHSSMVDALLFIWLYMPSFLAKKSVSTYPLVSGCALGLQSFFIDRGATKEQREEVLNLISHRQRMSQQGLVPPLVIFPEGGTSNGKYVT